MTKLKFSIIIPMYNVEQYIERCLKSIFNQEFPKEGYEIVLVNDGSPDNSEEVAKKFCKGEGNVNIITQENKGLGGARNSGIAEAKGEYLLFLDSDDWLLPNALKVLSGAASGEDVIEFSVRLEDEHSILNTISFENTSVMTGIDYYLKHKTINSACNKMYKREFLIGNNLQFMERIYGEDIQFNARAFYLINKIKSIDQQLIVFYQSDNSITRNRQMSSKLKYLNDLQGVIISVNKFKQEQSLLEHRAINYFNERTGSLIVNSILFALKNKIPKREISNFVNNLKKESLYNLNQPLKERNNYRIVFSNSFLLNLILTANEFRK